MGSTRNERLTQRADGLRQRILRTPKAPGEIVDQDDSRLEDSCCNSPNNRGRSSTEIPFSSFPAQVDRPASTDASVDRPAAVINKTRFRRSASLRNRLTNPSRCIRSINVLTFDSDCPSRSANSACEQPPCSAFAKAVRTECRPSFNSKRPSQSLNCSRTICETRNSPSTTSAAGIDRRFIVGSAFGNVHLAILGSRSTSHSFDRSRFTSSHMKSISEDFNQMELCLKTRSLDPFQNVLAHAAS